MSQPSLRTDFATRLYKKLAGTNAQENLFFSPFSIQVALAMCAVGARGATRSDLTDLIGAPDDVDEQNRQYASLLQSMSGQRAVRLVTANAVWGQTGIDFAPEFERMIAEFYDGAFHELDFHDQPELAAKTINHWVSDKTAGKIKDLVCRELVQDAILVLTNAIYFKGPWETVFQEGMTTRDLWHGPKPKKVPLMHLQSGLHYYEDDDLQAVNLPYQGRQLSMLVVLPRRTDGLAEVEKRWFTRQAFRQITTGFDSEIVKVALPRFRIETNFKLKPVLRAMHADLPFSEQADFSGIGAGPLCISEVVHKAFVEVNEVGTEAAAATAVLMRLSTGALRPPEPKVFRADHPFLFILWERKTGAVLFSGRVVEPQ